MKSKLRISIFFVIIITSIFANTDNIVKKETNSELKISEPKRDDTKQIVLDPNTNLIWQDDESTSNTKKSWEKSLEYCSDSDFAGFSDWRLPSRFELLSIVDKTKRNPSIKLNFKNVISDGYWSRSPHIADPAHFAWVVYFYYGGDAWGEKIYEHYIRCVRDNN